MATKRTGAKKTALVKPSGSDVLAGYDELLRDLKARIGQAQVRTSVAVNSELVLLYWSIERDILIRQQQHGWGAKIVDRLAADLRRAFPEMKGFSPRNLKYMRAFAEAWTDEAFVQEPLAQITWYQNLALLETLKSPEERAWYARQTIAYSWVEVNRARGHSVGITIIVSTRVEVSRGAWRRLPSEPLHPAR